MKLKYKFVIRSVGDSYVAVAVGSDAAEFNGMIKLNETGRIIWDMLAEGSERADIVKRICDEYEADVATVEADVDAFINTLQGANILE